MNKATNALDILLLGACTNSRLGIKALQLFPINFNMSPARLSGPGALWFLTYESALITSISSIGRLRFD